MADPFEVRVRFTAQLQHMNASASCAQKAASYALKYRDMCEDLHSCILEQIEKNNMNNRANIFCFIEHLCECAMREDHSDFVTMIKRDLNRIIDAVVPINGSGAANLKVARRVLHGLHEKHIIEYQVLQEMEACLNQRDNIFVNPTLSTNTTNNDTVVPASQQAKLNEFVRLDRKQIEQRIEEDRERHKRLRESIWAVSSGEGYENEKIWEEASECCDDDYTAAFEDSEIRSQILQLETY